MIFHDDILDKRFSDELYNDLLNGPWYADNIANRTTFPYGEKGSHLLLGSDLKSDYFVERKISAKLINTFHHLCFKLDKKLFLKSLYANLQFYGLDGTFHADGDQNQEVFILLLCNEIFDHDMGGEFINQTANQTVKFRHGRIIHFKATDTHKGLAFSKPYLPRISIKFLGEIK